MKVKKKVEYFDISYFTLKLNMKYL